MSEASAHVTPADLEALHQPPEAEGAGGKGCLTRHQRRKNDHQCSHQWHALVKAREDSSTYALSAYPNLSPLISPNKPGNYEHFKRPYWHNAHHIIPNGSLKNAIANTGAAASGLPNLIKQGLLKATYNLNDKVNMIILPMERKWGVLLGLPRHLKRDEVGPNEKQEFFSHANYSDAAEKGLEPIMNGFKKMAVAAMDSAKPHEKPDVQLSKEQLESLSRRIYSSIKTAGKVKPGEALSKLTSELFA
jgi:A nuclease family of the HNH/ENDO VII superfamily with conserved AHH